MRDHYPLGRPVAKLAYRLFMDMPPRFRDATNGPLQWAMGTYQDPHFNDKLAKMESHIRRVRRVLEGGGGE